MWTGASCLLNFCCTIQLESYHRSITSHSNETLRYYLFFCSLQGITVSDEPCFSVLAVVYIEHLSASVCLLLCRLVWTACCWYARHLCPFHIVLLIDDNDSVNDWLSIPVYEVCVCVCVFVCVHACVCMCAFVCPLWIANCCNVTILQEVTAAPSNLAVCHMRGYLREHQAPSLPHYESLQSSLRSETVDGEW